MRPDAFINGRPIYIAVGRGNCKSYKQLEIYAELMAKYPDSKLVVLNPRHNGRTEAKKLAADFRKTYASESDYIRELTYQDLIDTVNKLRDWPPPPKPHRFYMGGSGIPDSMLDQVLDFWKDSGYIVVARD